MRTVFLILLIFFVIGCNPKETTTPITRIFDPRVPGGTTAANPKIQDVIGLKADVEYDKVTLSWINPSIYVGLNFKLHVFRIDGDGDGFTLPDPGGPTAFLYYPRNDFDPFEGNLYVDQNTSNTFNLIPNQTYTYFIVVEKDDHFSVGKKVTVTIPERATQIQIPSATAFWKNYAARTGGRPHPDTGAIFMDTLNAGAPTVTQAKGQMAYAKSGTVLFISDTDNNRVMVYLNKNGLACYEDFTEGSLDFDVCIAINGMAPLQPFAVLGQANFSDRYSCQDVANTLDDSECLTAPTGLTIKNNTLFVSDNGNNRVKIYDVLPKYGCYNFENMAGDTTPDHCAPSRVIGKKGVLDLTNYNVTTEGDASLSCPNGLEVYNNNLYIADTCNNRVVVARNAMVPAMFDCNAGTWRTSQCVFGGQIGQPNLFSNENFEAQWDLGNFSYDYVSDTLVGDSNYLRRHIRNPHLVKIYENKLFIAGNENFSKTSPFGDLTLFGRIFRFDTLILEGTFPSCTDTTYLTGGCDASWVYGQRGFTKIPVTPFAGNYMDNTYTLSRVGGLELFDDMMFVTDARENIVSIWENAYDNSILGSPATTRVYDPQGVFDADNGRSQPDLGGLGGINFRQNEKGLVIFDAGKDHFYLIRIFQVGL